MYQFCSLFWEHCSVPESLIVSRQQRHDETIWEEPLQNPNTRGDSERVSEKLTVTERLAPLWTEWTPEAPSNLNHFMILYWFVSTRDYLLQSSNTYLHSRTEALQLVILPFLLCAWQLIPGCPRNRFLTDQSNVPEDHKQPAPWMWISAGILPADFLYTLTAICADLNI